MNDKCDNVDASIIYVHISKKFPHQSLKFQQDKSIKISGA